MSKVDLCDDEGCPHYGTPHVCLSPSESANAKLKVFARDSAAAELERSAKREIEAFGVIRNRKARRARAAILRKQR